MIGQKDTLKQITNFILSNHNTALLCGADGSGKETLINEAISNCIIFHAWKGQSYTLTNISKDSVKTLLEDVYKINSDTLYVIPGIDKMSGAAMNSLLKITEEPPNKAKFILTCVNSSNVLETIKSRSLVYYMQPYTPKELLEYYGKEEYADYICNVCTTPGDINILVKNGIKEFQEYVEKVFNFIGTASIGNALKIGSKLAFKDGDEGFDLRLFFRAFELMCLEAYKKSTGEDKVKYRYGATTTLRYLGQIDIKGINKSALFDTWVVTIKERW